MQILSLHDTQIIKIYNSTHLKSHSINVIHFFHHLLIFLNNLLLVYLVIEERLI